MLPIVVFRCFSVLRRVILTLSVFVAATTLQAQVAGEAFEKVDLLTIDNEYTASLLLSRCQETKARSQRWRFRFDAGLVPDIPHRRSTESGKSDRLGLLPSEHVLAVKSDSCGFWVPISYCPSKVAKDQPTLHPGPGT